MNGFFNTTHLTGDDLAHAVRSTQLQDRVVLTLFRASSEPMSPSAVWRCCLAVGHQWPLTSIRRAITNPTDRKLLERTETKVVGPYGRGEYQWRVRA